MPDGQNPMRVRRGVLWIALGRQRVGKTTVLNAAVQYFQSLGYVFEVWNADQQNRSHSLTTFFPDALAPLMNPLIHNWHITSGWQASILRDTPCCSWACHVSTPAGRASCAAG